MVWYHFISLNFTLDIDVWALYLPFPLTEWERYKAQSVLMAICLICSKWLEKRRELEPAVGSVTDTIVNLMQEGNYTSWNHISPFASSATKEVINYPQSRSSTLGHGESRTSGV